MSKAIFIGSLVFLLSFSLRLWNLNDAGRWTDEERYAVKGYTIMTLFQKGDFSNEFFYKEGADHPLFAVYFYGLISFLDISGVDYKSYNYVLKTNNPKFTYDLIYGRMLSVVISSISIVLVYMFCVRFLSYFVAITSSLILALMPHFLSYSQFVGLESFVMLTFTAASYLYFLYIDTRKTRYLILTGIFVGFCISIKQSGILIYPLLTLVFVIYNKFSGKKRISIVHLINIFIISGLTLFVTYPMPFFHLVDFYKANFDLWFSDNGKVPELLFGKVMGAPFFYYEVIFLVTTPVVILLLSFIGTFRIIKIRTWIYISILAWLIIPFFMSFFHFRQHMLRYIVQVYAPLSIVAGIGLEFLAQKFTKKKNTQYLLIIPLSVYLFFILLKITPYYLSYYNELVGGTSSVYKHKLFFIGWFGEGLKGSGVYLARYALKGSIIARAFDPGYISMYEVPYLKYEDFDKSKKYDYVVVNYFNVIRIGFDYNVLSGYKIVYREKAGDIDMARVYKRVW